MIKSIVENLLTRKSTWARVKIGEVCEIDPSKRELAHINKNTKVSFGMMADLGEHKRSFQPKETKTLAELSKGGYSYFKEKDVLLAKMTPCFENGKSGIAENLENGIGFGSTEFYVLRNKPNITSEWIYHIISSREFIEKGKNSLVGTTGRRRLLKQYVSTFEIPLPTFEDQVLISSLFNSIELALYESERNEVELKLLWKKLINSLISENPTFGNLLNGKSLSAVRFSDVAEKLMRRIDPLSLGLERIVAGENLESEDLKIRTWKKVGEDYLGPAFHVLFKKGDILYGSRRTYLKKVAFADFDGVCANTTYVLKAKEEILLQDLLKHIMLSERFTQYSISVSKGSTNPYINWNDLDNFSFQIPDIQTQKEISEVLDKIVDIIEQLKKQKTTLKNLKQKLLNEILG